MDKHKKKIGFSGSLVHNRNKLPQTMTLAMAGQLSSEEKGKKQLD